MRIGKGFRMRYGMWLVILVMLSGVQAAQVRKIQVSVISVRSDIVLVQGKNLDALVEGMTIDIQFRWPRRDEEVMAKILWKGRQRLILACSFKDQTDLISSGDKLLLITRDTSAAAADSARVPQVQTNAATPLLDGTKFPSVWTDETLPKPESSKKRSESVLVKPGESKLVRKEYIQTYGDKTTPRVKRSPTAILFIPFSAGFSFGSYYDISNSTSDNSDYHGNPDKTSSVPEKVTGLSLAGDLCHLVVRGESFGHFALGIKLVERCPQANQVIAYLPIYLYYDIKRVITTDKMRSGATRTYHSAKIYLFTGGNPLRMQHPYFQCGIGAAMTLFDWGEPGDSQPYGESALYYLSQWTLYKFPMVHCEAQLGLSYRAKTTDDSNYTYDGGPSIYFRLSIGASNGL